MPLTPLSGAADLITLAQLKLVLDVPTSDTTLDGKLNQAIDNASAAVRSYTGRNFGATTLTESRDYAYDRSGWLEIDDVTDVTSVTMDGVTLTANYDYVLGPDRGILTDDATAVYEWVELRPGMGQSPEMGFTRNLDTLYKFGIRQVYSTVSIAGTFGWPTVPADVQQAAIWTAVEFASLPQPFNSTGIAGYNVTQDQAIREAIPARAKELLNPYRRTPN